MHSLKTTFPGQIFALAKPHDPVGKRTRNRIPKEERKALVISFIKKHQNLNNGSFPSLSLTHKEVGGSFYTIREIVREIIQENRVLGAGDVILEGKGPDHLQDQSLSILMDPVPPLSLSPGGFHSASDQNHNFSSQAGEDKSPRNGGNIDSSQVAHEERGSDILNSGEVTATQFFKEDVGMLVHQSMGTTDISKAQFEASRSAWLHDRAQMICDSFATKPLEKELNVDNKDRRFEEIPFTESEGTKPVNNEERVNGAGAEMIEVVRKNSLATTDFPAETVVETFPAESVTSTMESSDVQPSEVDKVFEGGKETEAKVETDSSNITSVNNEERVNGAGAEMIEVVRKNSLATTDFPAETVVETFPAESVTSTMESSDVQPSEVDKVFEGGKETEAKVETDSSNITSVNNEERVNGAGAEMIEVVRKNSLATTDFPAETVVETFPAESVTSTMESSDVQPSEVDKVFEGGKETEAKVETDSSNITSVNNEERVNGAGAEMIEVVRKNSLATTDFPAETVVETFPAESVTSTMESSDVQPSEVDKVFEGGKETEAKVETDSSNITSVNNEERVNGAGAEMIEVVRKNSLATTDFPAETVVETFPAESVTSTMESSDVQPSEVDKVFEGGKETEAKVETDSSNITSVDLGEISSCTSAVPEEQATEVSVGQMPNHISVIMENNVEEKVVNPASIDVECDGTKGTVVANAVIGNIHETKEFSNGTLTTEQTMPTSGSESGSYKNDIAKVDTMSSHARNEVTVVEKATTEKGKLDSWDSSSSQKGNIATLNRIKPESWKGQSNVAGQETNPLLAVLKSFLTAFVKFWSE